jgi:hypothetical protein
MVYESEPLSKESKKHLNQFKGQFTLIGLTLLCMFSFIVFIIINS